MLGKILRTFCNKKSEYYEALQEAGNEGPTYNLIQPNLWGVEHAPQKRNAEALSFFSNNRIFR